MKKRRLIFFSLLIAHLVGGNFTRNYFTRPTGDQKVVFTQARAEHFNSGNLNYTIYRWEKLRSRYRESDWRLKQMMVE